MPFLKIEFYQFLMEKWKQDDRFKDFMGVVPICAGRVHPLAAIYKKEACTFLEEQLQRSNYRVRDTLNRMNTLYVDITGQEKYETMLQNVNTPQAYEKIIQEQKNSQKKALCHRRLWTEEFRQDHLTGKNHPPADLTRH